MMNKGFNPGLEFSEKCGNCGGNRAEHLCPENKLNIAFHQMWGKAKEAEGYNKEEWMELARLINENSVWRKV